MNLILDILAYTTLAILGFLILVMMLTSNINMHVSPYLAPSIIVAGMVSLTWINRKL